MSRYPATPSPQSRPAGPNALRRCGSGRKFKHCCGSSAGAKRPPQPAIFPPAPGAPAPNPTALPLSEAGRLSGALTRIQREHAAPPPRAEPRRAGTDPAAASLLTRARELREAGDLQAALDSLQKLVADAPDSAVVHHEHGLALLAAGRHAEAAVAFRRAVVLQPDRAAAQFNLALALDRLGDESAALAAYERAAAMAPGRTGAHTRVAELSTSLGKRAAAIAAFQRAANAAPRTRPGRISAAKALLVEGRLAEAEQSLRQTLARYPGDPGALICLGNALALSGRLDAAAAAYHQAIARNPGAAAAWLSLFQARKLTEADRPLVGKLVDAVELRHLPDSDRMLLHFAAGKAFDDLGELVQAMHHFNAANEIRGRFSTFDPPATEALVSRLIARFTGAAIERDRQFGTADGTPIFILGMPRSGTTLVEQIISSHPRVTAGDELGFWIEQGPVWQQTDTGNLDAAEANRLAQGYQAVLREVSPDSDRVTDKNPFNYVCAGLIHTVFPNAPIIHCRRHPIDTCLSIYTNYFANKMPFASRREDLVFYFRQYRRLTDHWRSVIPAGQWLDLDYEELVGARETLTRRLIAFCGLEWNDACLHPENNRRSVRTASFWQARQPVYTTSVQRWRRYEPWLGALRELEA